MVAESEFWILPPDRIARFCLNIYQKERGKCTISHKSFVTLQPKNNKNDSDMATDKVAHWLDIADYDLITNYNIEARYPEDKEVIGLPLRSSKNSHARSPTSSADR